MIDIHPDIRLGQGGRHGLLGLCLDDVSETIARFVPDDEFAAVHKAAANTVGDIDLKAKVFCREIAPSALRAVLRARDVRVQAKAIATNAAACRRLRVVRRTASGRARRARVARAALRTSTADPDGEPPPESRRGHGEVDVRR